MCLGEDTGSSDVDHASKMIADNDLLTQIDAGFRATFDGVTNRPWPSPTSLLEAFLAYGRQPIDDRLRHVLDGDELRFAAGIQGDVTSDRQLVTLERRLGVIDARNGEYRGTYLLALHATFTGERLQLHEVGSPDEPGTTAPPPPNVSEFQSRVEQWSEYLAFVSGQLVGVQISTGFA
jgi:hypothetical protein